MIQNSGRTDENKEEETQDDTQFASRTTISGLSTDEWLNCVLNKDRQIKKQKQQIVELNQTKSEFVAELQKQLETANKLNVVLAHNIDKCLSEMRELRQEIQNITKGNQQIINKNEGTISG
eukprot:611912_1